MAVALLRTYVQESFGVETEFIVKIRNTIFGPGLWVFAAGASALSLGGGSGTVVLGAPVDLAFELQPDPGSDVASSCVSAKLVAGDTLIGDSKIRIFPLPEVRGRPPGVRVLASIALDEPMLTVTLSAGCAGKITRTYTFLSELPTRVARSASALPVDLASLPSAAVAAGAAAEPARSSPKAQDSSRQTPSAKVADRPVHPAPAPRAPAAKPATGAPERPSARISAPSAAKTVPARASSATRPRLVLEPLDIWLDSPVALQTSPTLAVAPSDEMSPQRAQAAALWKSLNAQPEDLQKDSERLKALESEAVALQAQAGKDRAAAAQLKQQLDLAEQERFPATVVYALGALLLLALLVAAWAWARLRSASEKAVRSWRDSVALGARDAVSAHEKALDLMPHPGDTWLPSTQPPPEDPKPTRSAAAVAPPPSFVATRPGASAPVPLFATQKAVAPVSPLHIVNPEELFDIQQQAEFFISVGEHQQAIEVLKKHIAEHRETSPLAYLELLRLYHTLSRADEFAQLRTQFMQSFNALVPEFSGFHRTGRTLYHYTDALAQVEAEWTTSGVLQLLEKFLFRRSGAEAVEPFDLAAYDDLLLLLSIAQTTPASARGAPPPRQRTTPLMPPRVELPEAELVPTPTAVQHDDQILDSLAASLEFGFDVLPQHSAAPAPAAASHDSRSGPLELDLDLSEPPHLTLSDLPAVPVTAAPAPGQPVGFGSENDRMELRLELEQIKADRK